MSITILETGRPKEKLASAYGTYASMLGDLLASYGLSWRVIRVYLGEPLPRLTSNDALLITGSPHAVYEDHPWLPPLMTYVRHSILAGLPVVGICFGHQLMAEAMGGHVAKSANGWGVGIHSYQTTAPGKKWFGAEKLDLPVSHQDQIITLPPGATLLASSDFCPYAALAYGENALSVQAHPEIMLDYVRSELFIGRAHYPRSVFNKALASLEFAKLDTSLIADRMAHILGRLKFVSRRPVIRLRDERLVKIEYAFHQQANFDGLRVL